MRERMGPPHKLLSPSWERQLPWDKQAGSAAGERIPGGWGQGEGVEKARM